MADEYKHIMVESLEGREPEELAEVVQECERLKLAVSEELDRQDAENERRAAEEKQRRLEARKAAGLSEAPKAPGKKRGPRPKRERAAEPDFVVSEEDEAAFDAE